MSLIVLIAVCWCVLCCLCCFICKGRQEFADKEDDYFTRKANQKAREYFNGSGSDQEY